MKIRNLNLVACLFFATIICVCKTAFAETLISTNLNCFTENVLTVYESFEETIDYTNARDFSQSRYAGEKVLPGTYSAYTFSQSGIKLMTTPNIENNNFKSEVVVLDNKQFAYNFGVYGSISSSNPPVNGTHSIVQYNNSSESVLPYTLKLPYNVSSIGGYWFCADDLTESNQIEIDLYREDCSLICTKYITAASVSDGNWNNNYAGWSTADNSHSIRYLAISCNPSTHACHAGVDMLMFSAPEPSTIALAITGLFSAYLFSFHKKILKSAF